MSLRSQQYWENRYATGGFSGAGSRGAAAKFKARTINRILSSFEAGSVLDMGCGDGYLTGLIEATEYVGADVSATAIAKCKTEFPSKEFIQIGRYPLPVSDTVLSLDVVFHLVEDAVFEQYMNDVFRHARKVVVFYSTNHEDNIHSAPHVRHRHFTSWIERNINDWGLHSEIESPIDDQISAADFFVFTPL